MVDVGRPCQTPAALGDDLVHGLEHAGVPVPDGVCLVEDDALPLEKRKSQQREEKRKGHRRDTYLNFKHAGGVPDLSELELLLLVILWRREVVTAGWVRRTVRLFLVLLLLQNDLLRHGGVGGQNDIKLALRRKKHKKRKNQSESESGNKRERERGREESAVSILAEWKKNRRGSPC